MTDGKECQSCHQVFPKDSFYKRKDRNGEHSWQVSYCCSCNTRKVKECKVKNPEHYKQYNNNYNQKYYHENKDKYKIYQKRAYYKKLSPEKKLKYRKKLQENFPDIINQICL